MLTSDSPVGPWKAETGELLIKGGTPESAGVVWLFDPAVFVDDDGQGYLSTEVVFRQARKNIRTRLALLNCPMTCCIPKVEAPGHDTVHVQTADTDP